MALTSTVSARPLAAIATGVDCLVVSSGCDAVAATSGFFTFGLGWFGHVGCHAIYQAWLSYPLCGRRSRFAYCLSQDISTQVAPCTVWGRGNGMSIIVESVAVCRLEAGMPGLMSSI